MNHALISSYHSVPRIRKHHVIAVLAVGIVPMPVEFGEAGTER